MHCKPRILERLLNPKPPTRLQRVPVLAEELEGRKARGAVGGTLRAGLQQQQPADHEVRARQACSRGEGACVR